MAGKEQAEYPVRLQRIVVEPARAPRAAHGFNWARLGNEYVFEVGFVDFVQALNAKYSADVGTPGEPRDVPLLIIERFSLSADAVLRLSETVNGLMAEIKRASEEEKGKSAPEAQKNDP